MSRRNRMKANTGEGSERITNLQEYVQQRDDEAYRFLLRSAEGRWFIARMMQTEGIHAAVFTGNSATFYNEGRRAVVIGIRDKILSLGRAELNLLHQAEAELYDVNNYVIDEMKGDD